MRSATSRASVFLLLVVTILCGVATAIAAPGTHSLSTQIRQQFPLAANLVVTNGGKHFRPIANARAADQPAAGTFEADRYSDPYQLSSGPGTLILRPVSQHTSGENDGDAIAYVDAFRHVDALRFQANGVRQEMLVIHDPQSKAIEIEVARSTNIGVVAPFEGGVRFFPLRATAGVEALSVSRPLVIDAEGKPSLRAQWDVVKVGGATRLRLNIQDQGLRYPLLVAWAPGTATATDEWSHSALRMISASLQPRSNATGSISGTVIDGGTGLALSNQFVYIFDSGVNFIESAVTDGSGNYTAGGLATGTYLSTVAASGYYQQIYNGINCTSSCNIGGGTAINVTDGSNTANINFSLTATSARIAGTVTALSGGTPLPNVLVLAFDSNNNVVGVGSADSTGHYTAPVPAAGTYFARTSNNVYPGLLDQLYNGIDCASCVPNTGTPISVAAGGTTNGINFALRSTVGLISGTVTDAGTTLPIANATVEVFDGSGNLVTTGTTDGTGTYTTFNGLTAGNYFAFINLANYIPQLYNGIDCLAGCAPTGGTAIAVTAGNTTSGVNFALHHFTGQISGRVSDSQTNASLGSVQIDVFDAFGNLFTLGITASDGTWSVTLPTGSYFAATDNNTYPGYLNQLYNGFDCTSCAAIATGGTPISVTAGGNASGVNFPLHRGGSITAHVIDVATNADIPNPTVSVYDSSGNLINQGTGDANGNYTSFSALAAGNYYLVAFAAGYDAELYNGQPCTGGCAIPGTGTAVVVSTGQNTAFNFPLASSVARITGSVVAASDSSPLGGITVEVFNSSNNLVTTAIVASDGTYEAQVSTSGTYYARTLNSIYPQFGDQLYNHIDCSSGCVPSNGTGISATVGAVTNNINFALTSPACSGRDVSPTTIPNAPASSSYSVTFSAVGATAPVVWSVSGGVPPNLSINSSTGVLSGTLTTAGDYNFVVSFSDAAGCSAGRSYTMTVTATPTTTALTANPTSGVFGTSVVLTATVSPSSATGSVQFTEVLQTFGALLSADQETPPTSSTGSGNASFTLDSTHTRLGVSITVSGLSGAPTAAHIHMANPGVTGPIVVDLNAPANFVNGKLIQTFTITKALGDDLVAEANAYYVDIHTALFPNGEIRGQLSNTGPSPASVLGTATLSGGTASITITPFVGVHSILATYLGAPTFLSSESAPVTVTITQATPTITWPSPANIIYGTPLSSTQLDATATNPVNGAPVPGVFVYNPAAGTILNAGAAQVLSVSFTPTDTTDYTNATGSTTITVLQDTPVFSNLSAPTIILHTASTTISGTIKNSVNSGLIPPGSVSITLNSVTLSAAIDQTTGNFSATFDTSTMNVGTYTITFSYPGSANYTSATATSTLIDSYAFTGGAVPPITTINGQRALPIKIQLVDVNGVNVGSSSVSVTAFGVQLVGSGIWQPAPNVDDTFKFQNSSGGTYMFNLKVTNLASGNYIFGFTAGADPVIHTIPFTIN